MSNSESDDTETGYQSAIIFQDEDEDDDDEELLQPDAVIAVYVICLSVCLSVTLTP